MRLPAALREAARCRFCSSSYQLQRRPQARVFLIGHGAADAERLLAQLAIDHRVGEPQAGMLGRIEAGQGLGRNERLQDIAVVLPLGNGPATAPAERDWAAPGRG